jgi:flavin-dependent dehydrogenase
LGDRGSAAVTREAVDIAVVGGGLAGAVTAMLLAQRGLEVVVLERAPVWRWRACGVFTSPATVTALLRIGVTSTDLARIARPIPAMRVETRRGTSFGLSYGGTGLLDDSPVGLDRAALDPLLLSKAISAGADVRTGVAVEAIRLPAAHAARPRRGSGVQLILSGGQELDANVVVGADGLRSLVASAAGVARPSPLGRRTALTFHVPDGTALGDGPIEDRPMDARMVVIDRGYVGLAPVPGNRLNVGIVLASSWLPKLRREGAVGAAQGILEQVWPSGSTGGRPILDQVAGASPLGVGARRRAGVGWLLVGDAAGFLDPFTGEGIHRAIVSAELAAETISRSRRDGGTADLTAYDTSMRTRFGMKDVVSRVTQAFLGRPILFEYVARRLAARPGVRERMGLVIGDLAPASRALDPRYLAALLAP